MYLFCVNFRFLLGEEFKSLCFAAESGSMEVVNTQFVQIECPDCWKIIFSDIWCPSSFICPSIAAVKKEKSQMSFKSIIGPIHPIPEMATSNVCGLKRLEIRVSKNYAFF